MKRSFFQAAVVSILLYGCTTWTLTKRLEKKLDGNYTRMLRAILNKSCRQHPTRRQLYGHLPPITKTIKVRRARHARHCWRSKGELVSDVLLWTFTYGQAKAGRPARTYSHYVRTLDVTQKTSRRRWMIGRSGERWSGISVLAAQHDDDDDDDTLHLFFFFFSVCFVFYYICFQNFLFYIFFNYLSFPWKFISSSISHFYNISLLYFDEVTHSFFFYLFKFKFFFVVVVVIWNLSLTFTFFFLRLLVFREKYLRFKTSISFFFDIFHSSFAAFLLLDLLSFFRLHNQIQQIYNISFPNIL